MPFYKTYFTGIDYHPSIRTRDIDLLIPQPGKIKIKTNIPALLKDLGFIQDRLGEAGYIRLLSPDLIVEFLVPEKGRGSDKPFPLPDFGLNAQPLRFLNFLSENTITTTIETIPIRIPHPIHYALHKLVVASRRPKKDKAEKDRREGFQVLMALKEKKQNSEILKVMNKVPAKWKKAIEQELHKAHMPGL